MKLKIVSPVLLMLLIPMFFIGSKYKRHNNTNYSSNVGGSESQGTHVCNVHRSGRNYTKHPIIIYKNASVWNTHTPRDYYYWIKGLPIVDCEIPCIFTWNESDVKDYADVYFWDGKPGNKCDNYSLNFYSTMESPVRFPHETTENLRNAGYDILATMELDSDIPLPYLNKRIIKSLENSKIYPKRNDVMMSMFVSNCGDKYRLEYLQELMNYGVTVHSFGKCLHNMDVKNITGKDNNDKEDVIKRYKFNFCFENSVHKDYVTEKVYHALIAGTVPVYYGAPNFADFVPKNSVIDARSFSSPKELAEYLIMLSNNEEEYNKYHAWRKDRRDGIHTRMKEIANLDPRKMLCHLCIKAADMNRLRYGTEWIPDDKMWEDKNEVNSDHSVFLVRERGKYWINPVRVKDMTIGGLKKEIIKELRPTCKHCVVTSIYDKYNRRNTIKTNDNLKILDNYSELEAIILDF